MAANPEKCSEYRFKSTVVLLKTREMLSRIHSISLSCSPVSLLQDWSTANNKYHTINTEETKATTLKNTLVSVSGSK
jgi:hypothetical protein